MYYQQVLCFNKHIDFAYQLNAKNSKLVLSRGAIEGKTSKTAILPGFGKLEHGAPPCCRGLLWLEHAWLGLLWSDNDLSKATTLNNTYTL